ncbi:MAG: ABC transporter permease [Chloroflexi bacterium]|nr:ABC transporter permease [Chloroflexota bacterium]
MDLAEPRSLAAPIRPSRGLWADAFRRLLKNRLAVAGGLIVLLFILIAIFAPLVAPAYYAEESFPDNYAPPGGKFLMGADFMGRDVFSRIVYGARISLTVGIVGATMSMAIGVIYGSIAGYYGGKVDNFMMRFVDLMYAFPTLLLIILIMVYFRSGSVSGPETGLAQLLRAVDTSLGGLFFIFVGIGITAWMTMARLVRGIILSLKEKEFIQAARSIGAGEVRIIVHHLLPNFVGPIVVAETLNIPTYILYEAFLSFIGLGVNPPTPSWGAMINEGMQGMRSYPHLALFPALALALTLLSFNFLGDGLRDALDPRMR